MASTKGIVLTTVILAAVTGASFIFWVIPQENPSTFIVTDYEDHLDGIKKIHEVLEESVEIEFQSLIDGTITPEEYIETAQATSSQITVQITEFVKSEPREEWQESYINYMEALRKFNSYVVETSVAASIIEEGGEGLEQSLEKVETLKREYIQMVEMSDNTRP